MVSVVVGNKGRVSGFLGIQIKILIDGIKFRGGGEDVFTTSGKIRERFVCTWSQEV